MDKGFMIEAAMERNQPIPKLFGERPDLLDGDQFFMDAYWELSSCRYIALGPIPWTAIMEFTRYVQLPYDLVPVFNRAIRALDVTFLDWREKQLKVKK